MTSSTADLIKSDPMTSGKDPESARVSEIVNRYNSSERVCANLDLDEQIYDFVSATLDYADLSGSFIVADFRHVSLIGVNFSSANVKTCDFRGAKLKDANFAGAAIDAVRFEGANLQGASFDGASNQGHLYGQNEVPESAGN